MTRVLRVLLRKEHEEDKEVILSVASFIVQLHLHTNKFSSHDTEKSMTSSYFALIHFINDFYITAFKDFSYTQIMTISRHIHTLHISCKNK